MFLRVSMNGNKAATCASTLERVVNEKKNPSMILCVLETVICAIYNKVKPCLCTTRAGNY